MRLDHGSGIARVAQLVPLVFALLAHEPLFKHVQGPLALPARHRASMPSVGMGVAVRCVTETFGGPFAMMVRVSLAA